MRAGQVVLGSVLAFLGAFAIAGCANENTAGPSNLTGCNPACPLGQTCAAGHCESGPVNSSCNPACPLGQSCVNGSCSAAPPPSNACVPACPLGQKCSNGTCTAVTGCDPPCQSGRTCRDGVCISSMTPASGRPIGGQCADGSECIDGICFNPQRFPGGYCSKSCAGGTITQGASCPTASRCVQLGEAASYCLGVCDSNTDCRAGYACAANADGGEKTCIVKCKANADCPIEKSCNLTSGLCETRAAGMAGPLGAACTTPAECSTDTCASEAASNGQFPGGYCLSFCTAADANKPCADGAGICVEAGNKSFGCLLACNTGVDCRRDYMCSADAGITVLGQAGVCIPRCNFLGCIDSYVCDESVGICVEKAGGGGGADAGPMPGPGPEGVTQVELGSVAIGSKSPEWKAVTVDVPADAVSFTVIGKTADPNAILIPVKITAPSGKAIFDYTDPTVNDVKLNTDPLTSGFTAVLIPNAPRVGVVAGKYTVTVGSDKTTSAKMTALIKRQTGVPQGGSLPIVMWFTKNQYLNAQTAKTDPAFQKSLADFARIYQKIGIKLGPFVYNEVQGALGTSAAVIEDFDELGPLLANADTSPDLGLHLFFIEQFNLEGGSTLLGISNGIPGPPAYPLLPHSGVVLSLAYLNSNDGLGTTMAHEGGHYLGLWHVNERDGSGFDPLLDTPECTVADDANGDKKLSWQECLGKGTENLMFWSAANVPQEVLSNDQRFVLLRNPSIR